MSAEEGATSMMLEGVSENNQDASSTSLSLAAGDATSSNATATSTSINSTTSDQSWIQIGRMVKVARRTWSGINCPGGQGHITNIYYSTTTDNINTNNTSNNSNNRGVITAVDVKYLPCELKSRDRGIDIQYITDHNNLTLEIAGGEVGARSRKSRLNRQTTVNSRRCTNCGAFAIDCNNCDWMLAAKMRERHEREEKERMERHRIKEIMKQREREELNGLVDTESSSDSDDSEESNYDESDVDSEEEERRKIKSLNRHRKKSGKVTKRRRRKEKKPCDISSDEEDSADEIPLAMLQREKDRKARLKRKRDQQKSQLMQLMKNKREGEELLKKKKDVMGKTDETKTKKKRSRIRPEKPCALGSLPIGVTSVSNKATEAKTNTQTTKSSLQKQVEKNLSAVQDKVIGGEKSDGASNVKDPTYEAADDNAEESGSSSDEEEDILISSLKPSSATVVGKTNSIDEADDAKDYHGSASNDNTCSGNQEANNLNDLFDDDVSDKDREEELLTPHETVEEEVEQLLTPRELDVDEEELLTPRAMEETHEMGDGGFESEGDNSQYDITLEDTVKDIPWGNLPKFISDLHATIEDTRIPSAQAELSTLKRRFAAAKKQATSSLSQSITRRMELQEEFESIAEKG